MFVLLNICFQGCALQDNWPKQCACQQKETNNTHKETTKQTNTHLKHKTKHTITTQHRTTTTTTTTTQQKTQTGKQQRNNITIHIINN